MSNIILSPMLTEKSNSLTEQFNKYVFKVNIKSNKMQIKKALESRFDVKIKKVSTVLVKGKSKNTTVKSGGHVIRTSGYRESWKKAIITLNEGDKINLVEGEF
jgi:large subunit ribosomal protein L23